MDYSEIEDKLKPLLKLVDHKVLNDVEGLENPTTENLCLWFYERGRLVIPEIIQIGISETSRSECLYPCLK